MGLDNGPGSIRMVYVFRICYSDGVSIVIPKRAGYASV
jgi:hypothetical protein